MLSDLYHRVKGVETCPIIPNDPEGTQVAGSRGRARTPVGGGAIRPATSLRGTSANLEQRVGSRPTCGFWLSKERATQGCSRKGQSSGRHDPCRYAQIRPYQSRLELISARTLTAARIRARWLRIRAPRLGSEHIGLNRPRSVLIEAGAT